MAEGFEQSRDRLCTTHCPFGLVVVAAAHEDGRQGYSLRAELPTELSSAHSRHINIGQQADVTPRNFAGEQSFGALEEQHIESQDLQLRSQRAAYGKIVVDNDYRDFSAAD